MSNKSLIDVGKVQLLVQHLNNKTKAEAIRALAAEEELKNFTQEVKDMLGGKSIIYISQAEYDSLSKEEQDDVTKSYFIVDATDMEHEHINKEFLDSLSQELLDTKADKSDLFSGDYNDLENKPLASKTISKTVTFEFDGVEEGKTICAAPSIGCYTGIKIADLTAEDKDSYVETIRNNGCIVTYENWDGSIITETFKEVYDFVGYCDFVSLKNDDAAVIFSVEPWEWYINHANHYVTEPGIYFVRNGSDSVNVLKVEIPTNETVTVYNSESDIFINNNKVATEEYVDNKVANKADKSEIPTVTNDLTDELKANYDTAYERSESGQIRMYCIDGFSGSLLASHAPSEDRESAVFYSTKAYITSSGSIGTDGNINAKAFYEDGTALTNKYATIEYVNSKGGITDYNDLENKPEIPSIDGLATEIYVDNKVEGLASEAYVTNMMGGLSLMQITQEDYDSLETKNPNILYIII